MSASSQLISTDLRLAQINRAITRKAALIDVLRQRGLGKVADAEERRLVELRLRRNGILQQLQAEHQAEYVVWAERFADLYEQAVAAAMAQLGKTTFIVAGTPAPSPAPTPVLSKPGHAQQMTLFGRGAREGMGR